MNLRISTSTAFACILLFLNKVCGELYSDTWAVHIEGDADVARELVKRHGFEYIDEVGLLRMFFITLSPTNDNVIVVSGWSKIYCLWYFKIRLSFTAK